MSFRLPYAIIASVVILLAALLMGSVSQLAVPPRADAAGCPAGASMILLAEPKTSSFDPVLTLNGVLPTGSLGLPGEPITWVITVSNPGPSAGSNVVIGDTLREELRIDSVETTLGDFTVSAQTVLFTIADLPAGQTVEMRIYTTVQRGLPNGLVVNQALMEATGPAGKISRVAVAEVFVPTGLPPTGYPPLEDLPGQGEPSFFQLGLIAIAAVTLTALYVWHRGRRW